MSTLNLPFFHGIGVGVFFHSIQHVADQKALRPDVRLALLGLAVAVLGLLAVLPVVPQPVDLLLLDAQLDVVLELVALFPLSSSLIY